MVDLKVLKEQITEFINEKGSFLNGLTPEVAEEKSKKVKKMMIEKINNIIFESTLKNIMNNLNEDADKEEVHFQSIIFAINNAVSVFFPLKINIDGLGLDGIISNLKEEQSKINQVIQGKSNEQFNKEWEVLRIIEFNKDAYDPSKPSERVKLNNDVLNNLNQTKPTLYTKQYFVYHHVNDGAPDNKIIKEYEEMKTLGKYENISDDKSTLVTKLNDESKETKIWTINNPGSRFDQGFLNIKIYKKRDNVVHASSKRRTQRRSSKNGKTKKHKKNIRRHKTRTRKRTRLVTAKSIA